MSVAKIWRFFFLIISSSGVLSADDLCFGTENYTVTSMETFTQPVIVNTFTWCLQIPPRCPKTRTEMRQRYRVKTEWKSRNVTKCCEGYKMISSNDSVTGIRCLPLCEKCHSGVCVSPNECLCDPGYHGDNCTTECPSGTWGTRCKEKCNCTEDVPCNPVNGQCVCPAGLRGRTCNESCPNDRWGPLCAFLCECKRGCHPKTGRCVEDEEESLTEINDYSNDLNEEIDKPVNFTIIESTQESPRTWETTASPTSGAAGYQTLATTDNPSSPEAVSVSSTDQTKIRTEARDEGNSSTARPVIVLVSVPERRRNAENERGKFTMNNPFLGHIADNVALHDIAPPKTDYVKNIHKGDVQSAPIPLDIALIVVASIVSLGLTSVAVVMVLYMRSKLLETTRISIYEEAKSKSQENPNATRISSIITNGLPQTPVCVSPLFSFPAENGTMFPVNGIDSSNNYANGAATIGFRVSGDLRGFLQDHYDRPPSTRIQLQSELNENTEHVYDEIPLQSSPLHCRKNT